ncbi:MAG: hypothetical protein ABI670_10945 [Chloroflexota bacterium]
MRLGYVPALDGVRISPVVISRIAAYAIAMLLPLLAKLPTLNNRILFIDEPLYLAQAARLDNLGAFIFSAQYRVEPKFQLGLFPDIAALYISQPYAIFWLHVFALISMVISACLLIALSNIAFDSYVPGVFTIAALALYQNRSPSTAASLLETFQLPFLLASALFLFSGLSSIEQRKHSALLLFGSGASCALATLIKPPGIVVLPVIVGLVALVGREQRRFLLTSIVSVIGGCALPLLLFLMPYLFNEVALHSLLFSFLVVAPEYPSYAGMGKPFLEGVTTLMRYFGLVSVLTFAIVLVLGPALLARLPGAERSTTKRYELALLCMGILLFLGYATGQSKDHYLIAVLPFLGLFTVQRLRLILRSQTSIRLQRTVATFLVVLFMVQELQSFAFYGSLFSDDSKYYSSEGQEAKDMLLADYIRTNTAPQESIWVYYNSPEIYWLADRKPATDDPTGSWLSAQHTERWIDKMHSDLLRDKPVLIVTMSDPHYPVDGSPPLEDMPGLGELLRSDYECGLHPDLGAGICRLQR